MVNYSTGLVHGAIAYYVVTSFPDINWLLITLLFLIMGFIADVLKTLVLNGFIKG